MKGRGEETSLGGAPRSPAGRASAGTATAPAALAGIETAAAPTQSPDTPLDTRVLHRSHDGPPHTHSTSALRSLQQPTSTTPHSSTSYPTTSARHVVPHCPARGLPPAAPRHSVRLLVVCPMRVLRHLIIVGPQDHRPEGDAAVAQAGVPHGGAQRPLRQDRGGGRLQGHLGQRPLHLRRHGRARLQRGVVHAGAGGAGVHVGRHVDPHPPRRRHRLRQLQQRAHPRAQARAARHRRAPASRTSSSPSPTRCWATPSPSRWPASTSSPARYGP